MTVAEKYAKGVIKGTAPKQTEKQAKARAKFENNYFSDKKSTKITKRKK